ncbi:LytTR family DNA-binding domain-containing protein [Sphingomonas sp. PR090111-T3T-6A]|uniref:LytTR family DNA-binding domain-containing protein n=1 Tax=Sphingomonas sp. PR090111-T3T-6A TaxID=685778 RepID=UPI0012FC4150|nr:LytTR family DNA-binding domain-containing protein [Sphingomonas sp. PR090111-T3T-6A]
MSSVPSEPRTVPVSAGAKEAWAGAHRIGDFRRWLGTGGDAAGTSGTLRQTFLYSFTVFAALVAAINAMNVISESRAGASLFGPIVWEASSWLTVMAFLWVPWMGYRLAPPIIRPRWKLAIHIPGAILFALGHVSGFIVLRKLAYALAGEHYGVDGFWLNFAYELRKDVIGYGLFVLGFAFIAHLLRQQRTVAAPGPTPTFDIRDGARLNRVRLEEVLAIGSAGNYVEFVLRDGRRLMMRSPLSALEEELGPRGFVRTHRSWLVNATQVTGLKPEGSGDYAVEVDALTVPLSRRFPEALARLKAPTPRGE